MNNKNKYASLEWCFDAFPKTRKIENIEVDFDYENLSMKICFKNEDLDFTINEYLIRTINQTLNVEKIYLNGLELKKPEFEYYWLGGSKLPKDPNDIIKLMAFIFQQKYNNYNELKIIMDCRSALAMAQKTIIYKIDGEHEDDFWFWVELDKVIARNKREKDSKSNS